MPEQVSHAVIHFSGRVQGVGFRYETRRVAQGFEVAGVVENLLDGRVRLEIEGLEEEARAFVRELQRQLEAYIRETEERWDRRPRQLRGFEIAPTRR
ncbi:MAG: acylphosphatase [Opitutales bacterium]